MSTIKIFLASSSELEKDRRELEIFIGRENKALAKKNLFLELIIWEDFVNAMSRTRLQDEYNKAVETCDIFLLLFFSKVGKYTKEEFETAFGHYQETNKPFIFTYFKNSEIKIGDLNREDIYSLWEFQDRLKELGHFQTVYENIDELKYQLKNQLEKILENIAGEEIVIDIGQILEPILDNNEKNEKIILEILDQKIPKTKEFLMNESGFNKRKLNRIVNRLIKKNLISRIPGDGIGYWIKNMPGK